jgi:hypothetical protein
LIASPQILPKALIGSLSSRCARQFGILHLGLGASHSFFVPLGSQSPVTMDVMFELFDNELLVTDNTFHHVANRNYTN